MTIVTEITKKEKEPAQKTRQQGHASCENKKNHDAARNFWFALGSLTLLAIASRQINLENPIGTAWDEVHFGSFANHYINRSFYHDVHPPLGKMLVAGAMRMTGYNGTFNFSVGTPYPDFFNYVAVRSMIAVLGALLVPVSFLIVWEVSASLGSAVIAGLCVLCDTFIHRLNTLILLDPFLLLAILTSVYGVYKFHNQRQREWTWAWWGWLAFTGVQLGLVMSIKYVGMFTVLYVGLHTVFQLFNIATNKERPLWHVIPHTLARALCLIAVPIGVYLSAFVIHFWILTEGAPNAGGHYPTKFFMSLNNTEFDNTTFPANIQYGANITVQNTRPMIGYLESWYDLFPRRYSAPCQQVTTSTLRDPDALTWKIRKVDPIKETVYEDGAADVFPPLVRSGDFVILTHVETGRSLRTHGYRAPITKRHFQVCGYGDDGVAGPFETWQLLVPGVEDGTPLEPFTMDFELKSHKMNCYLKGNEKVTLPREWAFNGAKEVTCTRNVNTPGSLWHINWHISPKLKATLRPRDRAISTWSKIVLGHEAMFIGNSILIPTEEELERSARPWMWPILYQTQIMCSYKKNATTKQELFAVGMTNPLITYLNVVTLVALIPLALAHSFLGNRHPEEDPSCAERRRRALESCCWLLLCWAMHYLPFFFMSRVLYYHHYCPSYLFSCMITGVVVNFACEVAATRLPESRRPAGFLILLVPAAAVSFSYFVFFPIATTVEGRLFKPHPTLTAVLEKFHFGQLWVEFGFREDAITIKSSSKVELFDPNMLDNPNVNATLYYETHLRNRRTKNATILPVHASNFSLFTPVVPLDGTRKFVNFSMEESSDDDITTTSYMEVTTMVPYTPQTTVRKLKNDA